MGQCVKAKASPGFTLIVSEDDFETEHSHGSRLQNLDKDISDAHWTFDNRDSCCSFAGGSTFWFVSIVRVRSEFCDSESFTRRVDVFKRILYKTHLKP